MKNHEPSRLRNVAAEKCVLGAAMRWPGAIDDIAAIVQAEDFSADGHQKIFRALLSMNAACQPLDPHLVLEHLVKNGQADDAGRGAYLAELWEASPSGANVEHYAQIVRERSRARQLLLVAHEIAESAERFDMPIDELIASAEAKLFGLSDRDQHRELVSLREAMREVCRQIDARATGDYASGVQSGYVDLDSLIVGLQPSALHLIAARPSQGKTALGANIAIHIAKHDTPIYFVSLEQAQVEIAERIICGEARVDSRKVRANLLTKAEAELILGAVDRLGGAEIVLDDVPYQTVERIAAKARRLKRRQNIGAVFVDYIQLLAPTNKKAQRYEQVGDMARGLKSLAKELKVPVIAMAQLGRGSEARAGERPKLSDLRESGNLEQEADVVLLLHRERPKDGESSSPSVDKVTIDVAKNRNGPTGLLRLIFRRAFTKFENLEPVFGNANVATEF